MTLRELKKIIEKGEDSQQQFKLTIENEKALSSEIVAMSNAEGGRIFVGVSDKGDLIGININSINRLNNMISNTASQHIKSPVSLRSENIVIGKGLVVVCLSIPEGIDKPYFDKDGIIWLKVGADKRKINSKEELRRFFQFSDQVHADETPTKAKISTIDESYFRHFVQQYYGYSMPSGEKNLKQLLENLDLAKGNYLNLAGLLLFGENPQIFKPSFLVKSIFFPGTINDMDYYLDKEDHTGHFKDIFQKSISFIMRCLPKVQSGKSVNSPSVPEISKIVFEELLVNALVHRDYFSEAPVRIFVYQDRIEIINPGSLLNHLTIQKIKAGISMSRNPVLCSYASKGILPYSGLGTGIQRALQLYPHIVFDDDKELNQFKAIVHRNRANNFQYGTINETINETLKYADHPLIGLLRENPEMSYDEMAERLNKGRSTIYRNIMKLRKEKKLKRVGSRKTGYWEVCE